MEKPLFSIVVPCCDVAPYVGECVASLQCQKVPFEALMVVEESRDATERVLREAVGADGRFRVFTEPRSGSPSTPRNTGLAQATGDYVIFLDGDDTLSPTALADLRDWIERYPGTDLFPCAVSEGDLVHDNYPKDVSGLPLSGPAASRLVSERNAEPMAMAQMTVCRLAFLQEKGLCFVDGLRHEDEEFTPRALFLAASVVPTHLRFYLYRRREDSITTASRARHFDDLATVYENLFRFHAERNPPAGVSAAWARNWINTFYSVFFYEARGQALDSSARRTALARAFAHGAGDFLKLVRHASLPKRVAALFVCLAVKTGWYAPADIFFRRVYYPMCMRRK